VHEFQGEVWNSRPSSPSWSPIQINLSPLPIIGRIVLTYCHLFSVSPLTVHFLKEESFLPPLRSGGGCQAWSVTFGGWGGRVCKISQTTPPQNFVGTGGGVVGGSGCQPPHFFFLFNFGVPSPLPSLVTTSSPFKYLRSTKTFYPSGFSHYIRLSSVPWFHPWVDSITFLYLSSPPNYPPSAKQPLSPCGGHGNTVLLVMIKCVLEGDYPAVRMYTLWECSCFFTHPVSSPFLTICRGGLLDTLLFWSFVRSTSGLWGMVHHPPPQMLT